MYSKKDQTYKREIEKKKCSSCEKVRLIKFFSTPRALKCNTCKATAKRVRKKSSKSYLTDKKDTKWSLDVKKRDGFKCMYCGKTTYLNSHHIFSRSNYSTRWDLDNGITLCSGHHTLISDFSAHKTPAFFIEWLKETKGIEFYDRLMRKAKGIQKQSS